MTMDLSDLRMEALRVRLDEVQTSREKAETEVKSLHEAIGVEKYRRYKLEKQIAKMNEALRTMGITEVAGYSTNDEIDNHED